MTIIGNDTVEGVLVTPCFIIYLKLVKIYYSRFSINTDFIYMYIVGNLCRVIYSAPAAMMKNFSLWGVTTNPRQNHCTNMNAV